MVRCGPVVLAAALLVAIGGPVASAGAASSEGGRQGEAVVLRSAGGGLRYAVTVRACGDRLTTEWRTTDGSIAASEEVELAAGRWVRYRLRRDNIGQDIRAERRGDVVTIADVGRPGRAPGRFTGQGILLAGPELVVFLRSRLSDLRAGQGVDFQFLVADRGMAIGFRARGSVIEGGTRVSLEASNALVRPFVPATTFEFDAYGDLREVTGRMLPVAGRSGSPEPLDGVLKMTAAQSTCNIKSVS